MKRTKFVLLALAAAMVLMGAGYAAWTQSFNISGNVSTGELYVDVEHVGTVVEVTNSAGEYVEASTVDPNYLSGLNNVVTSNESDGTLTSISYSLHDMYPGTRITSTIRFDNTGTIGVKGNVSVKSISGYALWNAMNVMLGYYVDGEYIEDEVGESGPDKLQSLADLIQSRLLSLDTDDEPVEIVIVQELPYSDEESEKLETSWSLQVQFEQYNAQAQVD